MLTLRLLWIGWKVHCQLLDCALESKTLLTNFGSRHSYLLLYLPSKYGHLWLQRHQHCGGQNTNAEASKQSKVLVCFWFTEVFATKCWAGFPSLCSTFKTSAQSVCLHERNAVWSSVIHKKKWFRFLVEIELAQCQTEDENCGCIWVNIRVITSRRNID